MARQWTNGSRHSMKIAFSPNFQPLHYSKRTRIYSSDTSTRYRPGKNDVSLIRCNFNHRKTRTRLRIPKFTVTKRNVHRWRSINGFFDITAKTFIIRISMEIIIDAYMIFINRILWNTNYIKTCYILI